MPEPLQAPNPPSQPAVLAPAVARLRLPRTFAALRHRNFRLFWFGQLISLTGTWMQTVAQGWLVLELTNSPFYLGLVGFANFAPVFLFSLPAGGIADRVDKRRLLLATQAGAMLLALLLALDIAVGWVRIEHVLAAAALLGTVNAFDMPTRQSFVVEIAAKEDLLNAIALNSTAFNASRVVGPALAGALVAVVNIAWLFAFNGLSFIPVILALLAMRLLPRPERADRIALWPSLREGLSYILQHRVVLALVGLVAVSSVFAMPYVTLMPVFARDVLGIGPTGYGSLLSGMGVGALAGAIFLASLGDFRHKGLLVTAGNILFPTSLLFFSISRSFYLSLAILMVVGWSFITQNATINTLLQARVPDELRGRVMGVYILMFAGMFPLGSLQAGFVADATSAPTAVSLGALVALAFALYVFWRYPQIRRLE